MKVLIFLIVLVVAFDCTMAKKGEKKDRCKGSKKAVCAELTTCKAEKVELNKTVASLDKEIEALKEELGELKKPAPVDEGLSCNQCDWVEDEDECEPSACIAEHTLCMTMNDNGYYLKGCRSPEGVEKDKKICDPEHGCELTTCSESNCN